MVIKRNANSLKIYNDMSHKQIPAEQQYFNIIVRVEFVARRKFIGM